MVAVRIHLIGRMGFTFPESKICDFRPRTALLLCNQWVTTDICFHIDVYCG